MIHGTGKMNVPQNPTVASLQVSFGEPETCAFNHGCHVGRQLATGSRIRATLLDVKMLREELSMESYRLVGSTRDENNWARNLDTNFDKTKQSHCPD